jgi:hypothetical protein
LVALTRGYVASATYAEGYSSSDFNLDSYKPNTSRGICTNQLKKYLLVRLLTIELQFWLQSRVLAFEMMQKCAGA